VNQYSNTELIADMKRSASGTRGDNDCLYELVKNGDVAARRRMAEGNMYLVIEKVAYFIRRHPRAAHLRDDLTSAGFTGVLMAVKAVADGAVAKTNVTGYIAVCIGRELIYLMDSENPIFIAYGSRRHARQQGHKLKIPAVQSLPGDRGMHYDVDDRDSLKDNIVTLAGSNATIDPFVMLELRDTLAACCLNKSERQFMRLREAKYTYQEIAEALHLPVGSVHAMKKRLYERFLRR